MSRKDEFLNFGLSCLGFKSKQDLIENLFIAAIQDTYPRINKEIGLENEIRNRFIKDFYHVNRLLKDLIQQNILYVSWERWVFKDDEDLGRTDLSFAISGIEFILECKRLKNASQNYIDEGLLRFIEGEYSSNESYSGMIGFVINGDVIKIKDSLEKKCKAKSYIVSSFIKSNLSLIPNSFKTSHTRTDRGIIHIYHLFFEFSLNKE